MSSTYPKTLQVRGQKRKACFWTACNFFKPRNISREEKLRIFNIIARSISHVCKREAVNKES